MSLFLALVPPAAVCAQIALVTQAWRAQAQEARWVTPEDWHLTLHFLGPYASLSHRIEHIAASLAGWHGPRFAVMLDHTGCFGDTVWWLGIRSSTPLLALHAAMAGRLDAEGISRDRRLPYQAHVTLARTREALPSVEISPIGWDVDGFALMSRRPHEPAYCVEHEFPLQP